jgi:hypothetical protein
VFCEKTASETNLTTLFQKFNWLTATLSTLCSKCPFLLCLLG